MNTATDNSAPMTLPPGWRVDIQVMRVESGHAGSADVYRNDVRQCRLVCAHSHTEEHELRRALKRKADDWICEWLARGGGAEPQHP